MPPHIRSGIETSHTVMAHGDDRLVLGPLLHDLLREVLIDEHASSDARDRVLLRRPDIEQFDFPLLQQFGRFARSDLEIFLHVLALLNVFDHLVDIEAVVHRDGRKRVRRLKSTTAAAADVIPLKQRSLRRRKDRRDLLHGPGAGQVFRIRAGRSFRLHERLQRADVEFIILRNGGVRRLLAENSRK